MGHLVFVSHSGEDKEWAKSLVKELEAKGIHPWLDEYELHPGASWEDQIRSALAESDTLVAILGEGQPSPNVLVETGMALSAGKRIVPLAIGEHTDFSAFGELSNISAIQTSKVENAAEEILKAIDTTANSRP